MITYLVIDLIDPFLHKISLSFLLVLYTDEVINRVIYAKTFKMLNFIRFSQSKTHR